MGVHLDCSELEHPIVRQRELGNPIQNNLSMTFCRLLIFSDAIISTFAGWLNLDPRQFLCEKPPNPTGAFRELIPASTVQILGQRDLPREGNY